MTVGLPASQTSLRKGETDDAGLVGQVQDRAAQTT